MSKTGHWSLRARRMATGAALYLGAVVLGLGSAWWVLKKAPWLNPSVEVGAWRANMHAGSQDAGMYTRATVAVNALLALGRDETMYFVASRDDAGHLFLFDAPNGHYSLNGATAVLDAAGAFTLSTGPNEQPNLYWLPTSGQRPLVLTLRLYNPAPALQAAPQSLVAPAVQKIGDCA